MEDLPHPVYGHAKALTRAPVGDGLGQVSGGSDARLVTQCVGQLAAARDPELVVDALQMVLDRSHRDVTVSGDLLVGAAGGGLHGGVELAGGEAGPGRDRPDHRRGSAFATADKLRRPVLVGRRVPGTSAPSQHGSGFDARLGRIEEGAQSLEGCGDLMERLAVSGRHRVGIGGAGRHELAVHLRGEVMQAAGHLGGPAEAGQAVRRASSPDEVGDVFAEVSRLFELGPGGGKVAGGGRRPGPGLEEVEPDLGQYRNAEGVERGQGHGGLLRPPGYGQRLSGYSIRPWSKA